MESFTNRSEEKIIEEINELEKGNTSPYSHTAAGTYAQISSRLIELQRRSSLRSEKASKRFAFTSLCIAILSIIISIISSLCR